MVSDNNELKNQLKQLLLMIFLVAVIMGITALTAFKPILAGIPFNIIFPILVMIFINTIFFVKLKIATLVFLRILLVGSVFKIIPGNWFVFIVLIFLAINIFEASVADLKRKKYFNFVTGILLGISVLTLEGVWKGYIYEANNVSIIGTICWILAYTLWNFIFVTDEFKASIAKFHMGLLLVPIILMALFNNVGFWLLFRANSLIFGGGVIQTSSQKFLEKQLECKYFKGFVDWSKKKKLQIAFMIINIILILIPTIFKIVSLV